MGSVWIFDNSLGAAERGLRLIRYVFVVLCLWKLLCRIGW